jgi:DNA repair ATPase RecN
MKHKEMKVCIVQLQTMLTGNDIEPEQKEHVENAIRALKVLRRKIHPQPHEVARCVKSVVEELLRAFLK